MKVFYLICLLSIFQIFHPIELGGIKFALSEKMTHDLLYHFYPAINKEITSISLEDIRIERGLNVRELVLSIMDFNLDQIKIQFTEKFINITISGLKARVTGKVYINKLFVVTNKDIEVKINEFSMNAKLKVYSKKDENGKLVPYANFTETPTHTIDLDVDLENTLWLLDEALEPKIKRELKNAINKAFQDESQGLLNKGIEKARNYTVMAIDESNGLYIDYSLVDVKMKKGYLEFNSFAFLYNINMPETMQTKRLPLTLLPPITSVDNPNQLFISQYSLNSALYTYFKTKPLSTKLDIDSSILETLFPTFGKELAEKTEIFLETTDPPTLDLKLAYVKGDIYGKISLKVEGRNDLSIAATLHIETKIELIIKDNIYLSGRIYELEINVKKIEVGELHAKLLIEQINKLSPIVLLALNEYISKNVKFTLPVFFKSAEIDHKMTYLGINYSIKKEIYDTALNDTLTNVQNFFKKLYFDNNAQNYRTVIYQINQEIAKIFTTYFQDEEKTITKGYQPISEQSLQIADSITNVIEREKNIDLLGKKLTNFGTQFNIPDNPLSNLGNLLSQFMSKNMDSLNASPQVQSTQLTRDLNTKLASIICTIEQSVLNHHSLNKNYFVWNNFDFNKCTSDFNK